MSAAPASSLSDVEVRKAKASAVLPLIVPKPSLISSIAPVVLYIVSDAPFVVSIIMSTTVFALEWNLSLPPKTSPDAVLQDNSNLFNDTEQVRLKLTQENLLQFK